MKRIATIMFFSLLVFHYGYSSNHSMHPLKQISDVKKQIKAKQEPYYSAYQQLVHDADSLLKLQHHALVDFAVPGFYVKPKEHRANSLALQQDAFAAYCFALAYTLSEEKAYGIKACYFLNAWAYTNTKYSEHDGVLVMTYSGSGLMMAAELMSDSKLWSKKDKDVFRSWVRNIYQDATNTIRVHQNNWADWGRFGSLLAASFLEEPEEVNENIRLIKSDLFHKIATDGSMPEEIRRGNNGIWYTYFSLAPMSAACWLIYNLTGENLFNLEQNGTSIKKAIDYMAYYNLHPQEWKWDRHPNTGKDEIWPDNLLEAMANIYDDASYVEYVKDKRPIVYRTHHFCWTFPTLMPLSFERYK